MEGEKTQKPKQGEQASIDSFSHEELKKITVQMSYELSDARAELGRTKARLNNAEEQLKRNMEYMEALGMQNVFSYLNALQQILDHFELYSAEFTDSCKKDVENIVSHLHDLIVPANKSDKNVEDSAQTE